MSKSGFNSIAPGAGTTKDWITIFHFNTSKFRLGFQLEGAVVATGAAEAQNRDCCRAGQCQVLTKTKLRWAGRTFREAGGLVFKSCFSLLLLASGQRLFDLIEE